MEIKQLEYVIMAADMGSFNKASEFLYTTQSNVSKVIRGFEAELGYEIFRRQGSGVVLTDVGKVLYDQSQQILMMLKKIETFSELSHKICFHIGSVVSNFIATHFAEFVGEHDNPGVCLKMWEGNISYILDLVDQGEVEFGFIYIGGKQRESFQTLLQRRGLYFKEVLPARLVVCVGPNHPYYSRTSFSIDELKKLKYIRLMEDHLSKTYHLNQLENSLQLEKNMADAIEVGSSYALINIISKTDRVHLCYGSILDAEREGAMGIRSVPVVYQDEKIYLGYIHKSSEPLSTYGEEFLEQICEGYEEQD